MKKSYVKVVLVQYRFHHLQSFEVINQTDKRSGSSFLSLINLAHWKLFVQMEIYLHGVCSVFFSVSHFNFVIFFCISISVDILHTCTL